MTYNTMLPIHVRIGERREWTLGSVPADQAGRVHPEKLAELLIAVGEHMQALIDNELRKGTRMTQAKRDRRMRVDWEQLGIELETARERRNLSLRKVATQMDVPVSGLAKLRRGGGALSADAVARLMAWLYPRSVPWWITDGTNNSEEEDDV